MTQQRSNTAAPAVSGAKAAPRPGKTTAKSGTPVRSPAEKLSAVRAAASRKVEAPKVEAAKVEAARVEALKVAAAKIAAPKVMAPKVMAPKAAVPVQKTVSPSVDAPAKVVVTDAAQAARPANRVNGQRHGFKTHEFIVYPAHGVGQIVAIEEQEVAGFKLELFVINFIKDKMTLRVPTSKVASVGMRKLAEPDLMKRGLTTLTGRARIKRTMWSRRAQEYEAKINSGDLVAIAEVVRDLYRSDAQPEQSYSERQLYEAALDRMARELSAVQKLTETEALKLIESQLQKGPRRGKSEAESDQDADQDGDGTVEQAA